MTRAIGERRVLVAAVIAGCLAGTLLLSACTSSPAAPVPTGTISVTPAPGPLDYVSRAAPGQTPVGAKWDWSRYSAFTPYLGRLAGSFTTYELVWCQVEPEPGKWRWSDVDTVVSQTRALGIQLGLKVRTGACWATTSGPQNVRGTKDKTESVPPADYTAYKEFLRRAIHRYGPQGVTEWAIENEINSESMWRGTMSDYATLALTAAHLIRRIDANAVIVDPGLSSSTDGLGLVNSLLLEGREQDALRVYNSYFERRADRRDQLPTAATVQDLREVMSSDAAVNALSALSTVRELFDRGVFDVRQVHFYESWVNAPSLLAWLTTQSPRGTPLEVWEAGQYWLDSSASDQDRAEEVAKTEALLLAGGAQRVVWLPLAYDPGGRNSDEPRYGLVDPDGAERPAGVMVADLAALARGAKVLPVQAPGLQGVVFARGDVSTLVVWSSDGTDHSFQANSFSDTTVRPLGSPAPTEIDAPTTISEIPEVVTATASPTQLLEQLR